MSADIDHEYTNEIVCPWCGSIHGDSWERHRDEGSEDCQSCRKPFKWSRIITTEYSTEKTEEKQ